MECLDILDAEIVPLVKAHNKEDVREAGMEREKVKE